LYRSIQETEKIFAEIASQYGQKREDNKDRWVYETEEDPKGQGVEEVWIASYTPRKEGGKT